MKVEEKALRKMMAAIGMPVASQVPLPRLQKKVNILDKMLGDIKDTPEGDDLTLFRSVCAALEEGDRITVVPSKNGSVVVDTSEVEEDEEEESEEVHRETTQVVEDQEVDSTSGDSEADNEESSDQESEEEGKSMARQAVQDVEDLEEDREEVSEDEDTVSTEEVDEEEEEAPKPKKKVKKDTKKVQGNKVKGKGGPKAKGKAKKVKEETEETEDAEDTEDPEEPPQKPAKASKKAKAGEDTPKSKKAKEDGQVKEKGGPKSAAKDGKPGVIGSIIEFLKRGSEDKPLTKKKVVELLAKRFPDRDPESMTKTVSAQIGYHLLKFKKIEVSTDGEGGYWIEE